MKVLLIHQNFPGQYRRLVPYLVEEKGCRVVGLGDAANAQQTYRHPNFTLLKYPTPRGASRQIHPYMVSFEAGVRRGQAVLRACLEMQRQGFTPDVICFHAGWGEGLFLREVFPHARQIGYFEFFYRAAGSDVGFDPEFPPSGLDAAARTRVRNAIHMLTLESCDVGISPTHWQASQFPPEFRPKIRVVHEGIDTEVVTPSQDACFEWGGVCLSRNDQVITFVNRNLEPYRGFHVFMRSLPEVLARHPDAQVVIVGGDQVSYGSAPKDGKTWRQTLLEELGERLDRTRVHFVGRLPYKHYLELLRISALHVYLTYPFVLSWSLLEAMSAGCRIVASRTPPVQEVMEGEASGLLFDFFDQDALLSAVNQSLNDSAGSAGRAEHARQYVMERFDAKRVCLPQMWDVISGAVDV